jgi:hypothetical protein
MYIDYRLEEFRQLFGMPEPGAFLQTSCKIENTPTEKPGVDSFTSLRQSLEHIEQRLDALEKR